jgi:hypothetical protein
VLDAPDLPQQTLGNLTGAPWLSRLESLVIGDVGAANAGPLLNRGHALASLGERLHFELREDALPTQRAALREKFPRARLRLPDSGAREFPEVPGLSSLRPGSRRPFAERGLWALEAPLDAPVNYRDFPATLTELADGRPDPSGTFISSGARFGHLRRSTWCAWCASDRTLAIFAQPHADPGGRTWWLCEWRCEECGRFTSMRRPDAS